MNGDHEREDPRNEPVEVPCEVAAERGPSIGIRVAGRKDGRLVFLSREHVLDRGKGFVTIPRWLAEDRGLTEAAAHSSKDQGRLL
ncbi:hypothetical protein A7A08_01690 [Methyloligella halotolerans]|uniref:Uncharacterized protein n=1 Tax=Methyloligella halotolerans TaxID=1177755 RepID=A0A1E2RZZ1_9HYPH|nr:hypothetical protein [Methyloligella halotolerans]ODA67655.1 hypothetical protein A7A08_01690 [Methyloligella halotolerans]